MSAGDLVISSNWMLHDSYRTPFMPNGRLSIFRVSATSIFRFVMWVHDLLKATFVDEALFVGCGGRGIVTIRTPSSIVCSLAHNKVFFLLRVRRRKEM
jgi:hypothetical protein